MDQAPERATIYTVGYSIREWPDFMRVLSDAGITALADVRSHPSARLPQYRRENLSAALKQEGVAYVFLGDELGARRQESECYLEGRADYGLIAKLPAFRSGLERLERGAEQYRIALMCAEREPLDCHRSVLISRALLERGWRVVHLLGPEESEEHTETEERMIELVGVDPLLDAGRSREELLERAYTEYGRQIAYHVIEE